MKNGKEALAQRYRAMEAFELIRILTVDSEDYEPEALELARQEFNRRGLSKDSARAEVELLRGDLEAETEHESGSLPMPLKVACLLIFPATILVPYLSLRGRKQAAEDARTWALYGLLFWGGIGLLNLLAGST